VKRELFTGEKRDVFSAAHTGEGTGVYAAHTGEETGVYAKHTGEETGVYM
jgi:hypothetical protein